MRDCRSRAAASAKPVSAARGHAPGRTHSREHARHGL